VLVEGAEVDLIVGASWISMNLCNRGFVLILLEVEVMEKFCCNWSVLIPLDCGWHFMSLMFSVCSQFVVTAFQVDLQNLLAVTCDQRVQLG
jgi:hypothetical protein